MCYVVLNAAEAAGVFAFVSNNDNVLSPLPSSRSGPLHRPLSTDPTSLSRVSASHSQAEPDTSVRRSALRRDPHTHLEPPRNDSEVHSYSHSLTHSLSVSLFLKLSNFHSLILSLSHFLVCELVFVVQC
jgi:hypothetical protein